MRKQLTDKAYFVEMVFEHMRIIYKICNLYAAEEDRDDLKQEIIYQLWKSYPSFRGEAKFQSWMYRIALNTAMLGLRAPKQKYSRLSDRELDIQAGAEAHPEEENKIRQLYIHISKLKDLDKTIVFLYLEECSYEEIAEITGISVKNVSVRLVRIREKLRKLFNIQSSAT
ncbi:MAG: sigma-70 family RNA polymerase sigma factor [Bacteroidota bacterium]